jgi:hypothetical protein
MPIVLRRSAGRMTRAGALVAGLLGVALAGVAPPGAARTAGAAPVRIRIEEQPAWARLGDDVAIRLRLAGPVAGLEVRAVVYAAVGSRSAFLQTTTGDRLGSVLDTYSVPAEFVAAGAPLVLPVQDPRRPPEAGRLRIPLPRGLDAGVFPIEIELRDPSLGKRHAVAITHLVVVGPGGPAVGAPLRVAWIWQLRRPPDPTPAPSASPDLVRAVGRGRLGRLATAAAAAPVAVTLEPGPETLEAWARVALNDPDAAGTLEALREAAGRLQVLTSPYVPVDPVALEGAGLGPELTTGLTLGRETLARVLRQRLDPRITTVSPLNDGALDRLRTAGVDRVVVDPSALAPGEAPARLTPARPFLLLGSGHTFDAAVTDPMDRLLTGQGPAAVRAARFLAGLAVVALEEPNLTRGVVVRMPAAWDPGPAELQAVLEGLRTLPLLRPVPLDAVFDAVPVETDRGRELIRRPARRPPGPVPVSATALAAARADLAALESLLGPDDAGVGAARRALAVVTYRGWSRPAGQRRATAALAGISRLVRDTAGQVQPVSRRVVTLTSREAEIPVSLSNRGDRPVRVRVALDSDRLLFPAGAEQMLTLPPGKNTTTAFPVEARASGTFPMSVRITTTDGRLPIREVRYTVRSGAVSGVGVFLTGGAALFVAAWWILHWRRTRRHRPRVAAAT